MNTVYHTVNYRLFETQLPASGSSTLESMLRAVLDTADTTTVDRLWKRPQDRICPVSAESNQRVFLNKVADLTDAVFGELCLANSGDLLTLIKLDPMELKLSDKTDAVVYDFDERKAPDGTNLIRGLAYWLAIGNHLFFVKTQSMSVEHIRFYLEWLLKSQPSGISKESILRLQAEFDRSKVSGDIGEVRSLKVTGSSMPHFVRPAVPSDPAVQTKKTVRRVADRFVEFAAAVPVVSAILGPDRTSSLLKSLGEDEYLTVDASVKVKGKRTDASRAAFKALSNDLADASDAKVEITGKDGKVVKGDAILRTSMPFVRPHEGSNLLEFDNVADQLQEVYSRFVKDGKISAI